MSTTRTVAYVVSGLVLCAGGALALAITSGHLLLELAVWPAALIGCACHGLVELRKQIRNVDAG